jgi:pimeloyl-ACP methyl ester carboxylesterase
MGASRTIPFERILKITAPTLVMHGAAGLPFMKQTALKLSQTIPNVVFRTLEGQTHAVATQAVAPMPEKFFENPI